MKYQQVFEFVHLIYNVIIELFLSIYLYHPYVFHVNGNDTRLSILVLNLSHASYLGFQLWIKIQVSGIVIMTSCTSISAECFDRLYFKFCKFMNSMFYRVVIGLFGSWLIGENVSLDSLKLFCCSWVDQHTS